MGVDAGTWRRGDSLVLWSFALPAPGHASEAFDELRRASLAAAAALGDFAVARAVQLTTRSDGDGAATRVDEGGLDEPTIAAFLDQHGDTEQVFYELSLRVTPDGESEERIQNGARLWLSLDWPDPDRPATGTPALTLALSLDVDLYAAESRGASRENRALSVLNAPRLRDFLARLREELQAELSDLDRGSYKDQVTPDGFLPPTGTTH
ncbi:MAG TPA: hypothetical protein VMZ28_20545 [Kofleriaceae bacterium]|nr:hypothetical protein [Kofleriaceae bacterium]